MRRPLQRMPPEDGFNLTQILLITFLASNIVFGYFFGIEAAIVYEIIVGAALVAFLIFRSPA